jgi:hypothetical protein
VHYDNDGARDDEHGRGSKDYDNEILHGTDEEFEAPLLRVDVIRSYYQLTVRNDWCENAYLVLTIGVRIGNIEGLQIIIRPANTVVRVRQF